MSQEESYFLSILHHHKALIYKVVHCYCIEKSDQEDLTQEIFLQIWKSLEHFNGSVKVTTWIYKVALNTAISYYRKNKKHSENKTEISESLISFSNQEASVSEEVETLQLLIQRLKEFDKALILMHLDGLSNQEISEVIQISKTNVSTKISRIKKQLTHQYQQLQNTSNEQ